MNVVYASNENYVRHMAVSMYSLFDNNRKEDAIDVYILSTGILPESKVKLDFIAKQFKRKISFIELDDIKGKIDYDINTGRFDISAMSRLFIGELLPQDIDRVLYLDCDTVVSKELTGLWNTNLKENIIAAALEPTIYKEVLKYLGMDERNPYYNSGVLLIDLKAWRDKNVGQGIIDYYKNINSVSLFCDQDAINGYLKGRIKTISPAYNLFTNYRYFSYDTLTKKAGWFRRIPRKVYEHAISHPRIVHFAGDERPWKRYNLNPYRALYDIYLKLTPWADEKKEMANPLYMLSYHMMNVITLFAPKVRDRISDMYLMRLKEAKEGANENSSDNS